MFIQTEAMEHLESMKFLPGRPVMASGTADFSSAQSAKRSPLARRLFEIDAVLRVVLGPDFIQVTKAPEIAGRIGRIVLMGGAYFEQGNITPSAEFNIYVDPEAARIVFRAGVDIIMMPLDVTHRVLATKARVDRIRGVGSRAAVALSEMLLFSERFDEAKYGADGGPLHDPTTIAYLLRPALFEGRDCNVEIETASELTLGASVVDWWRVTDRPQNARVMRDVDADGFFDLLIERLANLP